MDYDMLVFPELLAYYDGMMVSEKNFLYEIPTSLVCLLTNTVEHMAPSNWRSFRNVSLKQIQKSVSCEKIEEYKRRTRVNDTIY